MTQPAPTNVGADRAFPSHPRLDRYFPSATAEDARQRLTACIERGDGPAVLIGGSGYGKTMLLNVLADAFAGRFAIAHLSNTQLCTRRALLQAILHAFGQPHRDRDEGELRLAMVDYLSDAAQCPNGALLLVDEAQTLAPRLLEEIRVLGNLARDGQPLVRTVLCGSSRLEECLAAPEMETLNQRIAARSYLAPLGYDDLTQYIRGHIAAVGADPDELLADDATAAVFEATDGVPRLINQLCERAIVLAVDAGASQIDRAAIQNAWSDLHQLPAPWHTAEPAVVSSQIDPEIVSYDVAYTADPEPADTIEPVDAVIDEPSEQVAGDATLNSEIDEPAAQAVWNADAALADVVESAVEAACEPSGGCDDCEGACTPPAIVAEPVAAEPVAAEPVNEAPATPEAAVDPFGEDFEDEETVLDRFIADDSPFSSTVPIVSNREDRELSTLLASLAPPAEATSAAEPQVDFIDENQSTIESIEPVAEAAEEAAEIDANTPAPPSEPMTVGLPFPTNESFSDSESFQPTDEHDTELDEEDESVEVSVVDTATDAAVLLVEDEPAFTAVAPPVRRQEYRQLFASLRGG